VEGIRAAGVRAFVYDPPPHPPEPIRSATRAAAQAPRPTVAPSTTPAPKRADQPVGRRIDVRA
jgi:hypothetical protein